jgi:hypothetical protein
VSVRDDIETLIARLPRLRHDVERTAIPPSGLYFFFEDSEPRDQIVRVWTHRSDGGLRRRLRHHFKGNRRGSVFRRHLGSAVLYDDERLEQWMDRGADKMPDVEVAVSRILFEHFEFSVMSVADLEERFQLEAALIGALAREPRMSPDWRGRRAAREAIRQTGLWNVERIDHIGSVDLNRLQELVDWTNSGPLG